MKTSLKTIVIYFVCNALSSDICHGQFTSANITDIAVGSGSSGAFNTGCDLLDVGSNDLLVAVWESDNNTSSIYFDDYNGNTGALTLFYDDAQDPDVALITTGTNIYAVVAYHTSSVGSPGAYVAEFYLISSGSIAYVSSSNITLLNNIALGSSINVDGNRNGDFIIVFQKDSSGTSVPVCVTGYMTGGGTPAPAWYFTTPVTLRAGLTSQPSFSYADVCIWDSVSVGTEVVYISYKNNNNGDVIIQEERWQNLDQASPSINYTTLYTAVPNINSVIAPRIACVNGSASRYEMTVVYSDGKDVESFTYFSGNGTWLSHIWTDGSTVSGSGNNFPTINAAFNTYPVVTYDGTGNNNVTIAWVYDNSVPAYSGSGYHPNITIPVGVVMDIAGTVITTDYFLDVPRTINTNELAISICGRFSTSNNNIGVVWFDNSTSKDIYYKEVQSPQASFRYGTYGIMHEVTDQIRVFDLHGRLLKIEYIKVGNIYDYLKSINLVEGVYLVRSISKNISQSQMYFVQ